MTAMLQTLASGRVVVALEGGYNLCSLQRVHGQSFKRFSRCCTALSQHRRALKSSAMSDIRKTVLEHRNF